MSKQYAPLPGLKWSSPTKRVFQGNALIVNSMYTRPKIVISDLAVSSAWVTTALQRALTTKTQTGHPPAFFVTDNLFYAKATAGSRKDPPTHSAPITSPSEEIKALMSMIFIIDIGEIVLLTNKFKAAANPVEKIFILAEHAPNPFSEAIVQEIRLQTYAAVEKSPLH
ncbi:hypothetical protein EVAR_66655_1 [Eumeta japonica]|uniref:Uncharacterized protein n=1 Tax=Eumeta variegata TaxID=151549 RepID=A0A4C1ZDW6_EUMVA|nr:hypothetical protein EVAR_66655_1 [Eumeta japonica]